MDRYIFGAKATAVGLYKALSVIEPGKKIKAFLVSERKDNPQEIWGCPVLMLKDVSSLKDIEKAEIYVAVPESLHDEVKKLLQTYGFTNLVMLNSHMEAELMERYFESEGQFRSIHTLQLRDKASFVPEISIYAASFYKDKPLLDPPNYPRYVKKLYLGCINAKKAGFDISGQADFYDDTGDNISEKNPNRCEMTAHYWIWKNRLDKDKEYVGVCHYRRMLDLSEDDIRKMHENDVDVVLPYPMLHYPSCRIQHTWYVAEKDWNIMQRVIGEMYPEYAEGFNKVFDNPAFYNYNMILAKKEVFSDYCAWLYPILDRIEELSEPKGVDRKDRYTAYLSESLTTLYFMLNLRKWKIYHTGRLLFV